MNACVSTKTNSKLKSYKVWFQSNPNFCLSCLKKKTFIPFILHFASILKWWNSSRLGFSLTRRQPFKSWKKQKTWRGIKKRKKGCFRLGLRLSSSMGEGVEILLLFNHVFPFTDCQMLWLDECYSLASKNVTVHLVWVWGNGGLIGKKINRCQCVQKGEQAGRQPVNRKKLNIWCFHMS